jgi:hypothetical protein
VAGVALLWLRGCDGTIDDGGAGDGPELGTEDASFAVRYELASLMCSADQLAAGSACPSDDVKCLCRPEFDALNRPAGATGNKSGKMIVITQPEFGKRDDGTYVFDAYDAIKANGNFVAHYVNDFNPDLSCTAATSPSGIACAGGAGCGWRCVRGVDRGDQIVDQETALYGVHPPPKRIMLNEAWSLLFDDSDTGKSYRNWVLAVVKEMDARGRRPLLFVQERHIHAGPFPILRDIASHAGILVEAYLSGNEVLNAPGQCAAPYDDSNWCVHEYKEMRNAVKNSADPPIPDVDLIMVEHFGNNTLHYVDEAGVRRTASWGRTYEAGRPTTRTWAAVIERRAKALQALPDLGGVGSYSWASNSNGTGSSYRIEFERAWGSIALP